MEKDGFTGTAGGRSVTPDTGTCISGGDSPAKDKKSEAVQALTALGYSASEAMKAVRQVTGKEEMDVETILKSALRNLALF